MKPLSLEALIFYCAKQLAEEEVIDEELLCEMYTILHIYFEPQEPITIH